MYWFVLERLVLKSTILLLLSLNSSLDSQSSLVLTWSWPVMVLDYTRWKEGTERNMLKMLLLRLILLVLLVKSRLHFFKHRLDPAQKLRYFGVNVWPDGVVTCVLITKGNNTHCSIITHQWTSRVSLLTTQKWTHYYLANVRMYISIWVAAGHIKTTVYISLSLFHTLQVPPGLIAHTILGVKDFQSFLHLPLSMIPTCVSNRWLLNSLWVPFRPHPATLQTVLGLMSSAFSGMEIQLTVGLFLAVSRNCDKIKTHS